MHSFPFEVILLMLGLSDTMEWSDFYHMKYVTNFVAVFVVLDFEVC